MWPVAVKGAGCRVEVQRERALKVDDLPLWLLGDATVEGLVENIPPLPAKNKGGRSTSGPLLAQRR